MPGPSERVDVAVFGGGPAGDVAALRAAQRGARVVLVEKDRTGGTCLNVACIYEALGSQVTVLEMAPAVLGGATDEAIAERLALLLRRRGMVNDTGRTVQRITRTGASLSVHTTGPSGDPVVEGDRVLLAAGRWPNTSALGLEALKLEMSGRTLSADEWMATSVPTVFFTRPEVATVGLTERQARAANAEEKVAQFSLSANPRAHILRETDEMVRLVCEAGGGRILGVHLLGARASDLIAEGALAVQLGATADDLAWTTHAHPTLPEAMLEVALGGEAIHAQTR